MIMPSSALCFCDSMGDSCCTWNYFAFPTAESNPCTFLSLGKCWRIQVTLSKGWFRNKCLFLLLFVPSHHCESDRTGTGEVWFSFNVNLPERRAHVDRNGTSASHLLLYPHSHPLLLVLVNTFEGKGTHILSIPSFPSFMGLILSFPSWSCLYGIWLSFTPASIAWSFLSDPYIGTCIR